MGSRIAAHFANAGIPVLLLDLTQCGRPEGRRDRAEAEARRVFHGGGREPDHAR